MRRRFQAILPAMDDGTSTKQTSVMPSEVNEDSAAIAAPRKIKVQPLSDTEKTKKSIEQLKPPCSLQHAT